MRHALGLLVYSLMLVAANGTEVTLTWDAPHANEDGSPLLDFSHYELYRCHDKACVPAFFQRLDVYTIYTDTEVRQGRRYRYAVTAVNTSGHPSALSNIADVHVRRN